MALIKSVTDATGSTLNRVGRTLTGGINNGASCSGTQSHSNNTNQSGGNSSNHNSRSGNQSPMIPEMPDNLAKSDEDKNGHNSQNVIIATKSQPISAHLTLDQRVKPRSRSLMRRSTRKSKVQDHDDVSQCLPS